MRRRLPSPGEDPLSVRQANSAAADDAMAAAKSGLAETERAHQKAVSQSRLHSFTAMVFGKDLRTYADRAATVENHLAAKGA